MDPDLGVETESGARTLRFNYYVLTDLLHEVVELDLLLPKPGDELLGSNGADLPLLRDDTVEEVRQAAQQGLLVPLVLCFILENLENKKILSGLLVLTDLTSLFNFSQLIQLKAWTNSKNSCNGNTFDINIYS